MSYTNETTHYAIPKPLGTDLTVPMDYNDAADAIDQALFDASTNATEAVTAAANAVEAAADAVEEVGSLGTEVNNLKGRTSALETSDVIQNNKIDALENQGATKFDSAGVADPYVNGLTYSVGDVVTYNGQRYKCTTAVVAAEPFDADKWSAEDVETVLNQIKSDLTHIVLEGGEETTLNAVFTPTNGCSITITVSGWYNIYASLADGNNVPHMVTSKVYKNNDVIGYLDIYIDSDATGSYNQNRNWSNVVHLNAGEVIKQVLEVNTLGGLSQIPFYDTLIATKIG